MSELIYGTVMVVACAFAVCYLAAILGDLFNPRDRRVRK